MADERGANYEQVVIQVLDVEVIGPGHGPITDKRGVTELKNYFEYLVHEVRLRYKAGLSVLDIARDIPMEAYANWIDPERIIVNVAAICHELSDEQEPASTLSFFALMAQYSTAQTSL